MSQKAFRWGLFGAALLFAVIETVNIVLRVTIGQGWMIHRLIFMWADFVLAGSVIAMIANRHGVVKGAINAAFFALRGRPPTKQEEKEMLEKVEQQS